MLDILELQIKFCSSHAAAVTHDVTSGTLRPFREFDYIEV